MTFQNDEVQLLQQEIEQLKADNSRLKSELNEERKRVTELQRGNSAAEATDVPISFSEYEEALRRLVQRTAMIVQAEKCVILVRDRETGDLFARSPAWGMTEEQVFSYRIPVSTGFSGECFRTGKAQTLENAIHDRRGAEENLQAYGVKNGVSVPLLIEKHDENSRVVDRTIIGVLHCFNKRYGSEFVEEDVRLLERLARNAAAVIANAQAYQEVMEEKQKLVQTLESLTAGLILINQRGQIAQINAQARAIFHIGSTAMVSDSKYTDVIKHEQGLQIIERCIKECSGEAPDLHTDEDAPPRVPDEITVTDDEGDEYIYQVHAAGVRDGSDSLIVTVFIFNDITDIRNVEKMKTEFVSIVSHELRTPLTPMKGFVRTLLDDENEEWYDRENRREFYSIIETNVDRLSRLINDLLNVSRIERGAGIEMNWQDVEIRKAAESVVDIQKGRTDRHTLVIDFDPAEIVAESDPDIIQNILQNFVSNAIKYSEGGEVRVIGRMQEPSEEYPDGAVLLGVKDQGIGLSPAEIKKVGEKFFRSDNKKARSAGGTGIGLFLVKSLIAAHHGTMWVESEVGKGSTFWFKFPIKQPVAEPAK